MPQDKAAEATTPGVLALLHCTLGLISERQPKDVFRRIAETACMLAAADGGALVVTLPGGRKELIEVGSGVGTSEYYDDGADAEEHGAGVVLSGDTPPLRQFMVVPIQSGRGFTGTIYLTEPRDGRTFSDQDEELVRSFGLVAAAIIDNANVSREARQQELWVALQGEIATSLLAGRSFVEVLDLVISGARELTRADVATLCVPDGPSTMTVSASDGRDADRLLGLVVPLEGSVSGEVVTTGQPVILTRAGSDPRRSEPIIGVGGIETVMVVPLALRGHATGALAVGRSAGHGPLTQTDFWLLETFAAQISVALEYARARSELERLALLDDQERIARDLHDTVIQQLFATGMSLQATARRIRDATITDRIQQAVEMLDATIRDIRKTVFALRSNQGHESFRVSLLALTEEVQKAHEFKIHMTFDGPVDTAIDLDAQAHLVATLREALSNVARHARASYVEVTLRVGTDIVLLVVDDGVGLRGGTKHSSGLRNLEARAQQLAGHMTLTCPPVGGTTLQWRIPLVAEGAIRHD